MLKVGSLLVAGTENCLWVSSQRDLIQMLSTVLSHQSIVRIIKLMTRTSIMWYYEVTLRIARPIIIPGEAAL